MFQIKLQNTDAFTIVDEPISHAFGRWKWRVNATGYVYRCAYGADTPSRQRTALLHREVIGAKRGQEVDHINGNKLDNRLCNLRFCDRSQNIRNTPKRKSNSSGFTGVGRAGKNFKAAIMVRGSWQHLGVFSSPEIAARAYDVAAFAIDPEFAKLNFPDSLWDASQIAPYKLQNQNPNSGFRGVLKRGDGWTAVFYSNGEKRRLGQFATAEEASAEYERAYLAYQGEKEARKAIKSLMSNLSPGDSPTI